MIIQCNSVKIRGELLHKIQYFDKSGKITALNEMLTLWVEESDLPTVLLIDEIDSLIGDTLISVLRQLRAGYDRRPNPFPQSVILCGVRDVRDYRIHSSSDGHLIIFDRRENITWDEKIFRRSERYENREILVWGM